MAKLICMFESYLVVELVLKICLPVCYVVDVTCYIFSL